MRSELDFRSVMEATTQQYSKLTFREILKILRDALRGTHEDYTAGSLGRDIFLLAVPIGGGHLLGLTSWCSSNCCGRTYRSNVSNPLCTGHGTLHGCNCARCPAFKRGQWKLRKSLRSLWPAIKRET